MCHGLAKVDPTSGLNTLGNATSTTGGELLTLGVVQTGCGTTGTAAIQFIGQTYLLLDTASATVGDAVGISTITPGYGTDLGSAAPTGGQAIVATVIKFPSGNQPSACGTSPGCYVQLSIGGGGGGSGSTNAVVTNPATTFANSIQSTAATAQPITAKCPASAAGTLDCLQVNDNSGNQVLGVQNNDAVLLGKAGGTVSLSSGTSSNTDLNGELTAVANAATYSFTGTYGSHPICVANDETSSNPVKVTYTGATSVTFTTSGATDVVSYMCHGRN